MDYLGRTGAPFSAELWSNIDNAVVSIAKKVLTARRFLPFTGSVGAGARFAHIDRLNKKEEQHEWFTKTENRQIVEIPQLYSNFWLNWRDLEADGAFAELSAAMLAAQNVANKEDEMIYYGIPALNIEGLLTVKGSESIKKSDWGTGEEAFTNVAAGIEALEKNGRYGNHTLVVSPDMYVKLQRIQPGTGVLEIERISKLLSGKIIKSTVLKSGTAFMVCAEPYCMDFIVGQDMTVSYLESVDMNHHLRVMETALLRIKSPDAIVIFK